MRRNRRESNPPETRDVCCLGVTAGVIVDDAFKNPEGLKAVNNGLATGGKSRSRTGENMPGL